PLLRDGPAGTLLRRCGRPRCDRARNRRAVLLLRELSGRLRPERTAAGGGARAGFVGSGGLRRRLRLAGEARMTDVPEPGRVQDGIRVTEAFARGPATLFWAQVLGNAGLLAALVVIARALGPAGRGTIAFIAVT